MEKPLRKVRSGFEKFRFPGCAFPGNSGANSSLSAWADSQCVRKLGANRYANGYSSVSILRQIQENGTLPSINNRVTIMTAPSTHCPWGGASRSEFK